MGPGPEGQLDVSIIATVLNERDSIEPLVASLLDQSIPPAEIVVADAGSSDGTRDVLGALEARHAVLRTLELPGDRSTGRNAAISDASHDIIACIDGGCVAEPDWLDKLTAPLLEGATWVAGFYRPKGESLRSTCIGLAMVWVRDEVKPEKFLPSARSMAFRREAWSAVGGFPEGTSFGEDTLFDERLLAAGYRPVFAGDAIVEWRPPATFGALAKTGFRWGRSDGQLRLHRFYPLRRFALYLGTPPAAVAAAVVWPPAVPLTILPLALVVARRTIHKYSAVAGWRKYLYIPAAYLIFGYAGVLGFLAGRIGRNR